MAGDIIVQCPPCIVCGHVEEMTVDYTSLKKWQNGTLIQEAFPDMPRSQREQLISGTCPDCWDKLWKDTDD